MLPYFSCITADFEIQYFFNKVTVSVLVNTELIFSVYLFNLFNLIRPFHSLRAILWSKNIHTAGDTYTMIRHEIPT